MGVTGSNAGGPASAPSVGALSSPPRSAPSASTSPYPSSRASPHAPTTIGGVARKTFTPKLPTQQREKKAPTPSPHAPSPSSTSPSSTRPIKTEGREKAPDRVSFMANSKDSRAKAGLSHGGGVKTERGEDGEREGREGGVKGAIKGSSPSTTSSSLRSKEEGVVVSDDDDVVMEEATDAATSRYPPITSPFTAVGSSAPSAPSSTPYRSAADVLTEVDDDRLLFFQLPSHLPLHPTLLPSSSLPSTTSLPSRPPPTPSRSPSSDLLPPIDTKDPTLTLSSSPSSSFSFQSKTALQKRLLTFHPQFENSLRWVRGGEIGRVLVMRSGRVKMEVGGVMMDVERGMECSFHQHVVSVHADRGAGAGGGVGSGGEADGEEGKSSAPTAVASGVAASAVTEGRKAWIELGEVRERLVCTLDVDSLIRSKEAAARAAGGDGAEEAEADVRGADPVRVKQEKE